MANGGDPSAPAPGHLAEVEQICDRYEAALRAGGSPRPVRLPPVGKRLRPSQLSVYRRTGSGQLQLRHPACPADALARTMAVAMYAIAAAPTPWCAWCADHPGQAAPAWLVDDEYIVSTQPRHRAAGEIRHGPSMPIISVR